MDKRILGRTGLSVSEIAFGGVEIGMPYGLGAQDRPRDDDAVRLLQQAVARGVNFFDTARHYGESERLMGEAFAGIRKEVVIATKCVHLRDADGTIPPYTALKDLVHKSLDTSLQNLKTDYIDLFMVHYADMEILDNDEVSQVFSDLLGNGAVRHIGVSVYKAEETARALHAGIWSAIQLPFNLMDQSHAAHFDEAHERGVGIIVRSVLMRGMLTEKRFQLHPELHDVQKHLEAYRRIALENFKTFPEYATKFALKHPQVSSVLVGIDKEEYLLASLRNATGTQFTTELLEQAQQLQFPDPAFLNLAEWDKKGWL